MKSLLAFGQRVGYLRFDVGAAVKLPPVKDALAERILDREAERAGGGLRQGGHASVATTSKGLHARPTDSFARHLKA